MSSDKPNEGIIVTGGTINSGFIATGRNAQATGIILQSANGALIQRGRGDLATKIEMLLTVLKKYEGELEDRDAAFEGVKNITKELEREKPRSSIVRKCLEQLGSAAGSVTAVANAMSALDNAVTKLL